MKDILKLECGTTRPSLNHANSPVSCSCRRKAQHDRRDGE